MQVGTEKSLVGETIRGKYKVGLKIGRGGMGSVYEAVELATDKKVAIKCLHLKHLEDEQAVQRFLNEAKLVETFAHENICQVQDIDTTEDGRPFFVMPLLKGYSLSQIIKQERGVELDRAVHIANQVLLALEEAHKRGIVHRDIKPSNIFITSDGEGGELVKLLDFGVSKIVDPNHISSLNTTTGTVLGTPHYMSPEQAKGHKEIDARIDIFAMGVVLYEALTGNRPFEGDSYNEVIFKIISDPFPLPTSLNREIPISMEKVVLKAMSRHPGDRYENAEQMRMALTDALENRSLRPSDFIRESDTTIMDGDGIEEVPNPTSFVQRSVSWLVPAGLAVIGACVVLYIIFFQPKEEMTLSIEPAQIEPVPQKAKSAEVVPMSTQNREQEEESDAKAESEKEAEVVDSKRVEPEQEEKEPIESKKKKRGRRAKKRAEKDEPGSPEKDKKIKGRLGTSVVSEF